MTPAAPIERIELFPLHVPFREVVRESMARSAGGLGMAIPAEEAWTGGDFVIVRLTDENGAHGLGEAFVWLPETGVSPAQVIDSVAHGLAGYVLGQSPFDVQQIRTRMDANVTRSEVAKGLLDMACYDLMGHAIGRPAHDFMGGCGAREMPLAALIPLSNARDMVDMALFFQQSGTSTFRFKLGLGIESDREIIALAREALGADARFRVDYNQAYSADQAVRAIHAIAPFGIDCAEQPVRASDWLAMARVQRAVTVPLMAHESCFSLTDVTVMIELGAIGVLGINTERPGGITHALRAIDYATPRGMGVVLHNQPLGIASAAQVHMGTARAAVLGHAMELFGHIMMEDDLVLESLDYSGGRVRVPHTPGLGVSLDEAALERYANGSRVVLQR